jgi:hypothetical protein
MTVAAYNPSSEIGQIRLLIPDRDMDNPVFRDEELDLFLQMEGSVRSAAAAALEVIATDEALVQKVLKLPDQETNGAATARVVLERAKRLRDQDTEGHFAIVEIPVDTFSEREYWERQGLVP